MALSTSMIAGLSSGFDWRSMIDQIMEIEHGKVDLVEDQKAEYQEKLDFYQDLNAKLLTFKTVGENLSKTTAFSMFKTSLSTNSSTYEASDFLSVSTSTSATPGTHTIEMDTNSQLAKARTISSKSFSTYDTALSLAGEFIINGRALEVETSDTLADIRDKINNLNSGANATGITASILTVSSSSYRLILTSDNTGKDAFTIFDASADSVDILQNSSSKPGLGFLDSTTPTIKNATSDGAESERFTSSEVAVGSLLGLTSAQTGTNITVGTTSTLDINLATESLSTIASNIDALSGVSASVKSITEDGITEYYLDISGTTNFGDQNNVLQTLGILVGGQSAEDEVHLSDTANTDFASANIVAGTTFAQIDTTGVPGNDVAVNDTITITGTDHDGAAISGSFDPADLTTATVQQLLTQIETLFGLGAGSAVVVDGKIQVTDDVSGDSQLSINLVANNEGGGTLNLGTMTASTEGYTMQTQAGQDARIKIDGTTITSSSNIIDDVIAGVTLNLFTVDDTTTTETYLNVSRDYDGVKTKAQSLLDQYNDVMKDINAQFEWDDETETAGVLSGDGTLRSIKSDLVNIVVSSITGLSSSYNALSLIGITSDNDGNLSIDADDFKDAFNDDFNALKRIFIAEGTSTDGDVQYVGHTYDTIAGDYPVNITQAATQASVTGNQDLSGGIGAGTYETLTIKEGDKIAAITLNGDSGENGASVSNIVNAINSELATAYAQSVMGNVKNTSDAGETTAITNLTTWDSIYSGGVAANLQDGDIIEFSGNKKSGTQAAGSYTITTAATDTVQGLLSAIEAAFDYEVSASINTNGYLVVTDDTTGNSDLAITITEPATRNLDFGDVTTSNIVGSERLTTDGTTAILSTTKWNGINGGSLANSDVFTFTGFTVDGSAVEGSYTITDVANEDVDDLLSSIKTAYDAAGGNVTAEIQDGRIVIIDGTSNSTLGINIYEPNGKGVDFGTLSGGVTGRYAVDVTASYDGSNYLVLTHDNYGSNETFTVNQSRHNTASAGDNQDYNQIIYTTTANTTDASSGEIYVSSSTTWTDIYGAGTIETGDIVTISGNDRDGNAFAGPNYTIDVSTDTIDDLLTAIETAFAGATTATTVEARIEQGKIVVEEQTSGDSQISLTLGYTDVGGSGTGTLVLGTMDQSTERDLDLGLIDWAELGLDVAGTINGESATGSGQLLKGDAPGTGETTSIEGLSIKYTGTATGSQGNVKITMGVAELFERVLDGMTNIEDGYLDFRMDSIDDRIDDFDDQILDLEARLERKMQKMINQFVAMELALSRIQNMSEWLAGQVTAANKGWA